MDKVFRGEQRKKGSFLQELHFVASDIALELIGDFAVVCLLSPKKSFLQRPKPGFSRVIAGLPGHAFQVLRPLALSHNPVILALRISLLVANISFYAFRLPNLPIPLPFPPSICTLNRPEAASVQILITDGCMLSCTSLGNFIATVQ